MQIPCKKDANTQHEPVKSKIQLLTSKKEIKKLKSSTFDNFMRNLDNKTLQGKLETFFDSLMHSFMVSYLNFGM